MNTKHQTATNIGVGLGLLLQFGGRMLLPQGDAIARVGWVVIGLGLVAFIWGCMSYAQGKGQHRAYGLLGLLSIIGLVILACLPDKHATPKGRKKNSDSDYEDDYEDYDATT